MSFNTCRTWGIYICLILMLNVLAFSLFPTKVYADQSGINVDATSAILIEASTGQILYSKNAHVPLPPASMSKMMTEYLVLDAIKNGTISWDDVVTTQHNAANTLYSGSRIWLAEGDKHTVEELYIAMAIASANDASVALAEYIAGTEEEFAKRMNQKAREIGLSEHAHFINATGLHREHMKEEYRPEDIPGETLLTAHDAAILAMNILRDHPNVTDYSSITYHQFRERDEKPMENLNAMLEAWEPYDNNYSRYAYKGADGFKTGYTEEAGNCFTGTAERDGVRLISVVMNSGEHSDKLHRFIETAKLFDYGFNNFEKRTILAAKSEWPELTTLSVAKGVESEVGLVTEEGIELIVNINDGDDAYQWELSVVNEEDLVAPIEKGEVLGTLHFTYHGVEKIERTVNLIATDDVEKAGWFKLLMRSIGNFFANIFNQIKGIFT